MTDQQWRTAWQLYQNAAALPASEQRTFVESATGDSDVRQEVLSMLEESRASEEAPSETLGISKSVARVASSLAHQQQQQQQQVPEHPLSAAQPAQAAPPQPFPDAARDGDAFGRYVIRRRIGRGGMGEVYAAYDNELDREAALKLLPTSSIGQQTAITRFIREAKALSALNHPNIVTVHEVLQRGDQIAIVMELVEGLPLRQMCGPDPMPAGQVARIGQQIAKALAAAHARGVVHRDIKPENVMVRPDGYAKVLDFGLARRIDQEAITTEKPKHSLIGTFRYMSPEQIREDAVTPASDVYSLGLVLYEMASGRHAFGSNTLFAALHSGASAQPPEPIARRVPHSPAIAALDELTESMLAPDPALRITAVDAARRLEAIERLAEQPMPDAVAASAPVAAAAGAASKVRGGHQEDGGSVRRKRAAWIAGLAATAGLAAAAITWTSNGRGVGKGPQGAAEGPVQTRPLTSQLGSETEPVLSADGEWIAYLWTDDAAHPPQLFVSHLGGPENTAAPVRLETGPGTIRALAWSPDGKRIAFRRQDGVWAVNRPAAAATAAAAAAAPPQRLAEPRGVCDGSGLDWSPDGKSLLLSECAPGSKTPAVFEIDLATGERRALTEVPPDMQGDFDPHYSPDGSQFAFRRASRAVVEDLYVASLAGAANLVPAGKMPQIQALSRDGRGLAGLAWMPDGKSLLVSSQRASGIYGLWRFYLDRPFEPAAFTQAGQHAKAPAASRKTHRAAWINQVIDHNIWAIDFDGQKTLSAPRRVIASLQRDVDVNVAPDGRLAFRSDRSGVAEIWVAQPDGSNPVRVTSMGGPLTGTPRWSPDGKFLAFDSRPNSNPDIYLLDCSAPGGKCSSGPPRRLTDHTATDVMPSWSRDGRRLYFASNRSGKREIWRVDVTAGGSGSAGVPKPVQVTANGGYLAFESPDAKWLYYAKIVEGQGVWRAPLRDGVLSGAETLVGNLFDDYGAGSWLLAGADKLLYLGSGKDNGLRMFDLASGKSKLLYDVPGGGKPIERGLALSPDGRRIYFGQLDRYDSNIMIAEGVR